MTRRLKGSTSPIPRRQIAGNTGSAQSGVKLQSVLPNRKSAIPPVLFRCRSHIGG
jgi:hypothetical protein